MYLLGGDTTANASLSLARNYLIWSNYLRSPGYTRQNPAEQADIKSYYIITREHLVTIYDHLTRMATVDEIVNANASKVPWEAKD